MEAAVTICVIGLVILVLLPGLRASKIKHHPISCSNNLKQIGLAFKIWEGDHNDKFPMGLSVTNGGTYELMETPEAWRAFQVMSNELSTPMILRCPQDSTRTNFTKGFCDDLKNNISYFTGIVADDSDPQSIVSGDDNFRLNNSPVSIGDYTISSNSEVEWDASRHFWKVKQGWFEEVKINYGYLMMADGSVQSASDAGLKIYIQQSNVVTNRLAIP